MYFKRKFSLSSLALDLTGRPGIPHQVRRPNMAVILKPLSPQGKTTIGCHVYLTNQHGGP